MNKPCPICGDPLAYPIWIDDEPPDRCAQDWQSAKPTIKNVTECRWQMGKAWQAAEFRKLLPDAFDEAGKMKPDQLGRVICAFGAAYPGKAIII